MKIPYQDLNISPRMCREAAIQAAEDYCKLINGSNTYKDATGNLRSSYGYTINGDTLVVAKGTQPIYSVDLPHVNDGNENE